MARPSKSALDVRTELGITQQELAEFLSIHRVMLARFETGGGSLPRRARDQMVKLIVQSASRKAITVAPDTVSDPDRQNARWKRQLKKEQHLLANAMFELRECRNRYQQSLLWYARIAIMQTESEREKRWVNRVRRRHAQHISTFGPVVQADIRLRIAAHEARIVVLNELLGSSS